MLAAVVLLPLSAPLLTTLRSVLLRRAATEELVLMSVSPVVSNPLPPSCSLIESIAKYFDIILISFFLCVGCVPKKVMFNAAHVGEVLKEAKHFGSVRILYHLYNF